MQFYNYFNVLGRLPITISGGNESVLDKTYPDLFAFNRHVCSFVRLCVPDDFNLYLLRWSYLDVNTDVGA